MSHSLLVLAAALFFALVLGAAGGVVIQRLRAGRQGRQALSSLDQLAVTLRGLESDLAEREKETVQARAQRDAEARKAAEYFDRIEGIVREADECRRLLVRTGAEHGLAQAMMLAEIDSLTHQYRQLSRQYREATGKPPPRPEPRLNSSIQVVAAEFREAHVAPYSTEPTSVLAEPGPQTGG